MLYGLVSPVQRSGSSIRQFVKRIPIDVRHRAVGTRLTIPMGNSTVTVLITPTTRSIRLSLRTRDPSEVKVRQAEIAAYVEQVFAAWRRDKPVSLSHRQATALAGELYRSWAYGEEAERKSSVTLVDGQWVSDNQDFEGEAELAFAATLAYLDRLKASGEPQDLEPALGAIIDKLLLARGIASVDSATRSILLSTFWLALRDAMEHRQRNATGDYSPDPKADRFPDFVPPGESKTVTSKPRVSPKVTLTDLVEGWWKESEATGLRKTTYNGYKATMAKFIAFLAHDDASRVTPEDVVRFKEHRLSTPLPGSDKPASPRTVKDSDLAGLKSVFNWAVANRKLPSNPAAGITIKLGKKRKLRETGFRPDEVKVILSASLKVVQGHERPETAAATRWIPWLLAYTGARVGEIAQLRKEDMQRTGDHWSILITPEAGNVKSNESRLVPLHPHLIKMGFADFVTKSKSAYLFLTPNRKTGDVLGPVSGVKNRVREFVRQFVTDPNVQPNHAWRHLFITRCRTAGVDQELRRMITGHSGQGVDEKVYGDPAGLYREICKLPRFQVP